MMHRPTIERCAEIAENFAEPHSLFVNKQEVAKAMRALPSSSSPEGTVLVPVEPTNKMLLRCQTKQAAAGYTPNDAEWLREIWSAMIEAASPAPISHRDWSSVNVSQAARPQGLPLSESDVPDRSSECSERR